MHSRARPAPLHGRHCPPLPATARRPPPARPLHRRWLQVPKGADGSRGMDRLYHRSRGRGRTGGPAQTAGWHGAREGAGAAGLRRRLPGVLLASERRRRRGGSGAARAHQADGDEPVVPPSSPGRIALNARHLKLRRVNRQACAAGACNARGQRQPRQQQCSVVTERLARDCTRDYTPTLLLLAGKGRPTQVALVLAAS